MDSRLLALLAIVRVCSHAGVSDWTRRIVNVSSTAQLGFRLVKNTSPRRRIRFTSHPGSSGSELEAL